MRYIPDDWTANQNRARRLLANPETFDEGKALLLRMHGLLHDAKVSRAGAETMYDALWKGLDTETCKIVTGKGTSILWNLWHITRIEDIVAHILIAGDAEVLNERRLEKLNATIHDTGNAMTAYEVQRFSEQINIKALRDYRTAVGKSTREIISGLAFPDMKRKVEQCQLEKIQRTGGVTAHKDSVWLLDFWGKKNVLGLLMMPITRHQTLHLNDCFAIKARGR